MPIFKSVNKDFFKKWSPEMAYVLGFFAADGYITVNRRGGQFWSIQITDKKLLESIKDSVASNHKISVKNKSNNTKTLYRLQIGSIEMCNDLRRLGYTEKKTRSLVIPKIKNNFLPHFVRGYFDGDGNVWVGFTHKDRKTETLAIQVVFTSCSEHFLECLKDYLESVGIIKGVVRKAKGDYYRLTYSVINSLKLYDFMYNRLGSSNLFLKRKKDVFERYKQMRL